MLRKRPPFTVQKIVLNQFCLFAEWIYRAVGNSDAKRKKGSQTQARANQKHAARCQGGCPVSCFCHCYPRRRRDAQIPCLLVWVALNMIENIRTQFYWKLKLKSLEKYVLTSNIKRTFIKENIMLSVYQVDRLEHFMRIEFVDYV